MHADEMVLPVVEVIAPFAEVEVNDADGIDFLDFAVGLAERDMLRDGFCRAIEQAFQVVNLTGVLHLDDDDVSLAVLGFDVHTVELVVFVLLVAFAFQNFDNLGLVIEKHGEESLQHAEVGFVAEQPFDGPIEADVVVFSHSAKCCVSFLPQS